MNMIDKLRTFAAGQGKTGLYYSLPALEEKGLGEDFPITRAHPHRAGIGASKPSCRRRNLKKDRKIIQPLVPVDLVVDHSVQVGR